MLSRLFLSQHRETMGAHCCWLSTKDAEQPRAVSGRNIPPMPTRPPPQPLGLDAPTLSPVHCVDRPDPGPFIPADSTMEYEDLQDMYAY